jgi:hypothetical protein
LGGLVDEFFSEAEIVFNKQWINVLIRGLSEKMDKRHK